MLDWEGKNMEGVLIILGFQNCHQGFHVPEGRGRQEHPDYQGAILVHPLVYQWGLQKISFCSHQLVLLISCWFVFAIQK